MRMVDGKVARRPLRRQLGRAAGALALVVMAGSACGGGAPASGSGDAAAGTAALPAAGPQGPVLTGIDLLLRDSLRVVRGRRVGLITNHTAAATIDRLVAHPDVQLVALFSPEHGIRGSAEAGEAVSSAVDARTGLPVHSLYGETREPTPAMLRDVDILLFDIQDIGTRYYTYVWTMALAMQAAGENDLPFVVLDRPNPIGGRLVQGNVLAPEFATFVGLHPVPMRHGLTAGELARLLVGELGVRADLRVIPLEGWSRDEWYDRTGLPWVPPSPNMPSLESATHYPGTCLFEGTNLSVGRGTPRAFQQIGAPWLDAEGIADRLNARVAAGDLAGVRFEAVDFIPRAPGDGKFGDEPVRGIRFHTTDRQRYDPTHAAVAALVEVARSHGDRLEWRIGHFDRLAGTDRLRQRIQAGADLDEATAGWAEQIEAFRSLREPYLLYR